MTKAELGWGIAEFSSFGEEFQGVGEVRDDGLIAAVSALIEEALYKGCQEGSWVYVC